MKKRTCDKEAIVYIHRVRAVMAIKKVLIMPIIWSVTSGMRLGRKDKRGTRSGEMRVISAIFLLFLIAGFPLVVSAAPDDCLECHNNTPPPGQQKAANIEIGVIESSIHSQLQCVDCHDIDPAKDHSGTAREVLCGGCHAEVAAEYESSIHGTMFEKGVIEAPTCTSCHGEHAIKKHDDPASSVSVSNLIKTCSSCHDSERLTGKFGLKANRVETFNESFHGTAIELGEVKAANCASCHGVHNIYPQSDSASMIHPANIQKTCGKCHDDLPEEFMRGTVHASVTDSETDSGFYVRKFYVWFIPIILMLFVLYRVLEYKRRVKRVD